MITKRIIPCLDIRNGRVVKGVNFMNLEDIESPVALARFYNDSGADELVFYDITASHEGRGLFEEVLREVAREVFIPLTVGGGVNTLDDFDRALKSGADKVSVNSGAIKNPALIDEAAKRYGDQCVVLSMDVKRVDGAYHLFLNGGRIDTGIDAVAFAKEGQSRGAGELVINSMDADGVKTGFDLPLLQAVSAEVSIPVIASGGAGCAADFAKVFKVPGVDAGLAASIFHRRELSIRDLKRTLMKSGVPIRWLSEWEACY